MKKTKHISINIIFKTRLNLFPKSEIIKNKKNGNFYE